MNIPKLYILPQIDFVGGATRDFAFYCYFQVRKKPYDMSSCSANFSIANFVNKTCQPLVSKSMTIGEDLDVDGSVRNVLRVTLDPLDTVDLPTGKYIYQISIRDVSGDVEIPKHGIIYIANNINKDFVK